MKKEVKKEKQTTVNNDQKNALYLLFIANVFFVIPLVVVSLKILLLDHVLYMIIPMLLMIIMFIYGYNEGKKYEIPIITFIISLPAMIILFSYVYNENLAFPLSSGLDTTTISIILSAMYFCLSVVFVYIGSYFNPEQHEIEEKK